MPPQATRDQIRAAIKRHLSAVSAHTDAQAALKAANERVSATQADLNASVRDLASLTGDAGFVFDGKLVRVTVPMMQGALSLPTVTVSQFANLDVLDVRDDLKPISVTLTDVKAGTAATTAAVPAPPVVAAAAEKSPAKATPSPALTGGVVPEAKGKK